ncbi:MAG: hypothetical protein HYV07_12265 [Deltaproteobacteria bacterium]|nr:hypothetical protein [Deltaproteobacteria bacterium]
MSSIQTRTNMRPVFDDVFMTFRAASGASSEVEIRGAFEELARAASERGALPFQDKVYGLRAARTMIHRARASAYSLHGLDPSTPYSFHEGRPLGGGSFAGAQLWGIVPKERSVGIETIEMDGIRGRRLRGDGFAALHLCHVHGLDSDGRFRDEPTAQASRMFDRAEEVLGGLGFGFRDVVRTWIYSARLLDWYGGLNKVRTKFFDLHGVGADAGRSFPASTGIQGISDHEEVSMDVLAIRAGDGVRLEIDPLHESCRQDRPFDYGSAFSRAMRVGLFGGDSIFVSGTASIERSGQSVHIGNEESQILETLLSIGALLRERGAGLEDIVSATVFCKTETVLSRFQEVARLLAIPSFPYVAVLADVCRPELLVEVEAVAARPAEARA